ncbi:leucine-rich repeat protein [Phocaeicola dorei]|uniref:leucine-rich repeat protein n=1 Tax=Phocaeicola dorei TaxID=357276 RepID=UPI00321990DE
MKLKKISILFILLPLCIFFTACSKENDNAPKQSENIIDFEQGNMNFTEGAGEQTFSFTTNTAWVVSVASTRNRGVPWCTVAPTSGNAGSHTIKVTTTPNETYDDRSVTVTLKAGAEVKSFVVSQKQKDALLLTNDKFEVDQAGGTVTVEVKSNVSYTATIGEECKDWIKESNSTRALSTTTKSYTVAMNEDGKKREGSIIFSDGSLTETVHIYQAGGSIILLSQNDCHVSASGEEITVELRSNCDYEVVMPSVDWIKETMTRGMSSHTLHYTVAPNDSYDGRKTEIIYRDKSDSSIADTLTILQAQKDAIIISEKEVKVGSEGGTVEVKIDANVDFEMQLPDVEWISETSTRGLSTHKKYLKIAENTGETSRTAEVVFKNTTSGIEETLTVSQSAKGKRVKVHVEKAGTLSDYIAESEKLNVEELEVSGNLGGKDIAFIREMAGTYNHANTEGKLVYLDMTEANIVADGEYYLPNSSGKEYLPTENTIGERMFTSRGLQTILLPKSVTSIDDRAFSSCHSLNKVVIYENSVKTIGMAAFEYCSSLADIVLPEGVTTIARSAFWGCSSLSRIDLPEGVTTIGHSAFYGCEKLSSVKLPNSLTTIEGFAFSGCNGLTITIPDNVESMSMLTFSDCTGLDITIPGRFLTKIENPIGSNCKDVRVTIAEGTTVIEEYAFQKRPGIVSVTIPESVTSIGHAAFWQCSGLTDIIIPSSVTEIGDDAFSKCTNLTNVTLPDGLTFIGEGVFRYCKGLVSVVIPNSVKSIEYEAFNGCSALKSIVLPEGMTLIKKWTFADCSSLVDVTLPSTMTTLEYGAFENCTSLRSVTIPNSVNTVDAPFYGCSSLSDIKVPDYLYETSIFSGTGITDITVPEGTTVVGSFADCTKLASITFPEGIKALTDFSGCSSLRAIDIPDGVSVIGSALFRGCVNLTKVTIPNSVVSLEWFAFSDCSSLTRITIPNHIATISSGAFSGCSLLTNVTLGSGVASIEDIAFHNAPIRQLRCYAVVPPKLHGVVDGSFSADLVKGATLYVPAGTGMAYSESDWKIYFENIVEMEE